MPGFEFEVRAVDVSNTDIGNALEDIGAALVLNGVYRKLQVQVYNTGAAALTDFALLVQPHANAAFHVLVSAAEWGTLTDTLQFVRGAINTLAAGAKGIATVNIGPAYAVKFQGKCATSTSATVLGTVWR